MKYGVGGINIDECRIETNGELIDNHNTQGIPFMRNSEDYKENSRTKLNIGRFPANTILTYGDDDYDEVCGGFPYTKNSKRSSNNNKNTVNMEMRVLPQDIFIVQRQVKKTEMRDWKNLKNMGLSL